MLGEFLKVSRIIRFPFFKIAYLVFNKKNPAIFKQFYKGKTILIVGNGPSLNSTPLEKFTIPSIGMNKINLLFDKTFWRPNFIMCNNGLVMKQNQEFFENTEIPVLLDFKAFFMRIKSNNIYYYLTNTKNSFSEKFYENVGGSGTVTYAALQFAYLLGAKRIIIVGVDHSFKGYDNSKIKAKIETYNGDDVNHFDPNYFKDQKWGIPNLEASETGYQLAYEFFKFKNIEIYDATINGKLDVFPKISISDALEMISKSE